MQRLNETELGTSLRTFCRANLASHSEASEQRSSRFLNGMIGLKAYSVSGDSDYSLMIKTVDLSKFSEFVHRQLLQQENVVQVRSEIILMAVK
jgi:DNA-binding Lrp family transcriptional regulator